MAYKEVKQTLFRYKTVYDDERTDDIEELIAMMDDKLDAIIDLLKAKKKLH